jgi:hypothetical protein
MADMSFNPKLFAGDPQRGISAATEFGLNALKPILHFQVQILRMWADNIERLAGNYEKGAAEVATAVKEQSNRDHAA